MNHQPAFTSYTPLESLLLFQSILTQGVDAAAFGHISEQLKNNGLIKADKTYDAARLSPEALSHLFLQLVQDDLRGEGESGSNGMTDASTSPGSKKRKLGSPPLPSLKDVAQNIQRIPALVERLYARYRDNIVEQIREEEQQFHNVQKEVQVLERNEEARLARITAQNGLTSSVPREVKPAPTPNGQATPMQTQATPAVRRPSSITPVISSKPLTPTIAPPGHLPPRTTPPVRPSSTGLPANGPAGVLQAPSGVPQPPSRVLQAPIQPPRPSISPRPDATTPIRPPPVPAQQVTTSGQQSGLQPGQQPGLLKWEKPYRPPNAPQTPRYQSPAPKVAIPQQHVQHQQQWQHPQQHHTPGQSPAPLPQISQPGQPQGKPVLVPPPNAGQMVPQMQRPIGAAPLPQPRPQSKTPVPPPQHRPIQPQQSQQPRPIAASPAPTPGAIAPPQRWPPGQLPPQQAGQKSAPAVSPAPSTSQKNQPYNSPYAAQAPHPAIPEHMIRHAAAGTPMAPRRTSTMPTTPITPIQTTPMSLLRGFGTKWAPQSTPSTPGALNTEPQSPAFEPCSPQQQAAKLPPAPATVSKKPAAKPKDTPDVAAPKTGRGLQPPSGRKGRRSSTTPSIGASSIRSQSVMSPADESSSMDPKETEILVKKEDAPLRLLEETGDTTADESIAGRKKPITPGALKRKRQETPIEPPGPPTEVLWTRGFTKVSSSALDQISSHRDANMFATGVREKDAPNYHQIVLQPQSITSIRAAIKSGNKAAVAAANTLTGGDPGTASVWLPISEDLMPPKGIINSAQLERELVHMFCNAIMYNPDPYRGPGTKFIRRSQEDEDEGPGYEFDENGVVRNTQSMFLEVEKLLGDLRSAEKDRGVPSQSTPRPGSVATMTAEEEDELADGDAESGTTKRRRMRG